MSSNDTTDEVVTDPLAGQKTPGKIEGVNTAYPEEHAARAEQDKAGIVHDDSAPADVPQDDAGEQDHQG